MKRQIAKLSNSRIVRTAGAAVFALAATFIAGAASSDLAIGLVQMGLNLPLREPLNFAIVFGFFLLWQRLSPKTEVNFCQSKAIIYGDLKSLLLGALAIAFVLGASWLILILLNQVANFGKLDTKFELALALGLVFSLSFILIHGLAEQFLLAFVAQETATQKYGTLFGILIVAFVFCTLQYLQGYRSIGYILSSIGFGLLIGVLSKRFGMIAAASLHGFWTWIETVLIPTFYKTSFKENLFAGGTADTYQSLAFAIVCTLVAICLYFWLGLSKSFNYKAIDDKIQP